MTRMPSVQFSRSWGRKMICGNPTDSLPVRRATRRLTQLLVMTKCHASGLMVAAVSIVATTVVGCIEPLEPAIVSVLVTPGLARFASIGAKEQFTATAHDADGTETYGKTFIWESSDESVVTVNGSGLVTAVGIGHAKVVATCEGIPDSATATVGPLGFPFIEQPSYTGNCVSRPAGSVCLGFEDGYIWLIYDSVTGWDGEHGDWYGQRIVSAIGFWTEYYHVLGTNLVFEGPL